MCHLDPMNLANDQFASGVPGSHCRGLSLGVSLCSVQQTLCLSFNTSLQTDSSVINKVNFSPWVLLDKIQIVQTSAATRSDLHRARVLNGTKADARIGQSQYASTPAFFTRLSLRNLFPFSQKCLHRTQRSSNALPKLKKLACPYVTYQCTIYLACCRAFVRNCSKLLYSVYNNITAIM